MQAKPLNKPTPVNLAQHTYWNLEGQNSGTIFEHEVQIFASHITPVDDELIPIGKLEKVEGTPFDFRKPHTVGSRIKDVPKGFDINYALDIHKTHGPIKPVAKISEKKPGRMLNKTIGKGGSVYGHYDGLCLETQGFPDAVNHPKFPSIMVAPEDTYHHYMFYKFSTKK
ncbi:Aldose 1-epimerase [Bienertia sinuspersici]